MKHFPLIPLVFVLALNLFSLSSVNHSHAWYPMNVTGNQLCGEAEEGNNEPCTGGEPLGQNAHYGRDASANFRTLTKLGSGEAGFDFTNISNSSTYIMDYFDINFSAKPTDGGEVSGTGSYLHGALVTARAIANPGYSFINWTENNTPVSTVSNYSFPVTDHRTLTANFVSLPEFTILLAAQPTSGGKVTGGGTYFYGSQITASAVANTGYSFVTWIENSTPVSNLSKYSFSVSRNRKLTANFVSFPEFTIQLSAVPTDGGEVFGGGHYSYGTQIMVTAAANPGYSFVTWTENNVSISTQSGYTFHVDNNRILKAIFRRIGALSGVLMLLLDEPNIPALGQPWTDPVTNMEFVWVPDGCFSMGNDTISGGYFFDEFLSDEICLNGYWIGKYEVTQGQWKRIMESNPSYFKPGDDYPVESVSWHDVQVFIRILNSRSNLNFRLPTEAEWEYAARSGGQGEIYAGGDDLDNLGWHDGNSNNRTHIVGTKSPNGLGIYDMSGNVWEWVSDSYRDNQSDNSLQNPQSPVNESYRVLRGGSWYAFAGRCSTVNRNSSSPGHRNASIGFRLAFSPDQHYP